MAASLGWCGTPLTHLQHQCSRPEGDLGRNAWATELRADWFPILWGMHGANFNPHLSFINVFLSQIFLISKLAGKTQNYCEPGVWGVRVGFAPLLSYSLPTCTSVLFIYLSINLSIYLSNLTIYFIHAYTSQLSVFLVNSFLASLVLVLEWSFVTVLLHRTLNLSW